MFILPFRTLYLIIIKKHVTKSSLLVLGDITIVMYLLSMWGPYPLPINLLWILFLKMVRSSMEMFVSKDITIMHTRKTSNAGEPKLTHSSLRPTLSLSLCGWWAKTLNFLWIFLSKTLNIYLEFWFTSIRGFV